MSDESRFGRMDEANDMNNDRLISLNAAKDYIDSQKGRPFIGCTIGEAMKIMLDEVPPAQPESLTDKEQRIFLAAMGREEKVCKQVDAECRDCREPYEDSLVRTCHEIIRKVKGALWT